MYAERQRERMAALLKSENVYMFYFMCIFCGRNDRWLEKSNVIDFYTHIGNQNRIEGTVWQNFYGSN